MAGKTSERAIQSFFTVFVASVVLMLAGQPVEIDVYVDSVDDLGAFELALEVTGGTSAELKLEGITVDSARQDYVFYAQTAHQANNLTKVTLSNAMENGSVQVSGSGYLATYTYQPVGGASGVFTVAIKDGTDSFLNDGNGAWLPSDPDEVQLIGVGVDCYQDSHCDDSNDCTMDTCTDNECAHQNLPQGGPCDDGLYCTETDECDGSGVCVGSGTPCWFKFPQCCEASDQCVCSTCQCGW